MQPTSRRPHMDQRRRARSIPGASPMQMLELAVYVMGDAAQIMVLFCSEVFYVL